jgi:Flp pilus assembly protein TadD
VFQKYLQLPKIAKFFAFVTFFAILALGLIGCQTAGPSEITGSIGSVGEKAETSRAEARRDLPTYRERHRLNPKDVEAAVQYGKALRAVGQKSQAVAVLEQASIANPGNRLLLAGYGRALADNGNFQQAFDVLGRAHSPEDPDWHILSVQGAALDQLGRYEEARQYYTSALKITPDEPAVLSNLGLSYLLSKDLPKRRRSCAAPTAWPVPICASGSIWRWSLVCRAGPLRPNALRRLTCRRRKPPRMSRI